MQKLGKNQAGYSMNLELIQVEFAQKISLTQLRWRTAKICLILSNWRLKVEVSALVQAFVQIQAAMKLK